jgi:3-oxoacyl-[acyl-carrier protein] reductase
MTVTPTSRIAAAFDLTGRTAVVTGAARGIGRASAALLADAGAFVVCGDIDEAGVADAAAAINAGGQLDGPRAVGVRVDVTDRHDVDELVSRAVAHDGRIDVMVNNAAIIVDGPVLETTEETLDRVHAVNFKGVFFGCQSAGRHMVAQRSGSIVNIASGAIDVATPNLVCYGTAKAAVAQLGRTLAVELGPSGVRVNTVAPGWIDTPMNERHVMGADGSIDADRKRELVEQRSRMSVLGLAGDPDDIAFAVLYLASDAARFVTGVVMRPNGGSTMPW